MPCPELEHLLTPAAGGAPSPTAHREVYFPQYGRLDTPVWRRDQLPSGFAGLGPAVIEEFSSTTIVDPPDRFSVGPLGELRIELGDLQTP